MEIGIIIEFNEENGSGIIGNWNERKYILHEYNRSDLKKGDIVIYDCGALQNYHNNERIALYCYNIYRLKDKRDVILKSLDTKLFSDFSSLICLVFPEFIDKVILKKTEPYLKILNNLNEYLTKVDFKEIIKNYKIELYKGGNYKPGKDHTAYAYIESIGHDLINEYDLYLKDLLPEIKIDTYRETGVIWSKKHDGYNSEKDEKYALNLHKSIKYRAKLLYNIEAHKESLEKLILERNSKIRKEYIENILNSYKGIFSSYSLRKEFNFYSLGKEF